jgi:hypothetical protein
MLWVGVGLFALGFFYFLIRFIGHSFLRIRSAIPFPSFRGAV